MLNDVGKSKETTLPADNASQVLRHLGVGGIAVNIRSESVDFLEEFVFSLWVADIFDILFVCTLAECEIAFCDIFAVIVVYSRRTDAFIL